MYCSWIVLDSTSSSSAQGEPDAFPWQGSHASQCHRRSDLKYDIGSEPALRGWAPETGIGCPPPASRSSVTSIISPLERCSPRKLVQEIFLLQLLETSLLLVGPPPRVGLLYKISQAV